MQPALGFLQDNGDRLELGLLEQRTHIMLEDDDVTQ
jgi:hypothetical protein